MKFTIEKMMCGGCVSNVTEKLEALDGVTHVNVDLESARAEVEGSMDTQAVVDALKESGYPAMLLE